jgi:L-aspartate oxidase
LLALLFLKIMEKRFDFLVIGSGIAGLSFALKVAEHGKVAIVSKGKLDETNTAYAQGGIAAVTYTPDTFEKHISDTLTSGDGLCDEKIVRMVIEEGPAQIKQLIEWGTDFDKKTDGKLDLAKEGGHSEQRVLHHKDNTGFEIERVLCEKARQHKNISIFENHFAVDLITQHHLGMLVKSHNTNIECYGAYVLDLNSHQTGKFLAKVVLVATGGAGNIYFSTTNPSVATGDGIAMVYRAKGVLEDMEFMQFHPTSLYNPGERPSFLITEAMRGFGAVLRTQDGQEFMQKYDKRGSLATRDIAARAIDNEMKIRGDEFVYLDARHLDKDAMKSHFPNIYEKCKSIGIDIFKDMIPVVPAAHFLCGGIKVDINGCSWIKRLYAAGEASCTGLHGANRLASNSLLEGIVYAERASRDALQHFRENKIPDNIPDWNDAGTNYPEEMVLITQNMKEMQSIMSYYVGIVRSDLRLKRAMDRLSIIFDETEELYKKTKLSKQICELRNLTTVCYLIIKGAQQRRESVGLHYNMDCPHRK